MKIAVLYQKCEPPAIGGIKKPMKPGGYSDSGADIAYCLRRGGFDVITPCENPDIACDYDWVFPDTFEGISSAVAAGADTLWLNTVLYKNHPVSRFGGIGIIGQSPADAQLYDDKFFTNSVLRKHGLPVACDTLFKSTSQYGGKFPCIIKPIRGRGSQGVSLCKNREELNSAAAKMQKSGLYGDVFIVEEFLPGQEITIPVFPNGQCLTPVERFNHQDGIAPYNGRVAVTANSRAVKKPSPELGKILTACSEAVRILKLKALVRIDCRMGEDGEYRIFDFNLKPNMTLASRAHRPDQDSLVMISAAAENLSRTELLSRITKTRWILQIGD